jgi:transcriptional regulator with XRE-family HTH domain
MKDDRAELQYQVGQRLRLAVDEIMSREGITKTEVARRTHTTLGKLNNWIRGDNFPDPLFVVRLYDLFGVTADWLYLDKLPGLPSSLRTRIADVGTESRAAKPAARRRASQKRY